MGPAHNLAVEVLLDRLRRLQGGEPLPRVVVLRAESGVGKTRVVREVYNRLRREHPVDANGLGYWPPLPVTTPGLGGFGERMPVRKWIGPDLDAWINPDRADVVRGRDMLPTFYWWAVACERRPDSGIVDVSQELNRQLQAHAPFLVRAWKKAVEPVDRYAAWVKEQWPTLRTEGLKQGGIESLSAWLSSANILVPGVGPATDIAIASGMAWWRRHALNREIRAGGDLHDPGVAPASIAEQLARFGHPQIPLILAVEDMHLMGSGLAALLAMLAQPNPGWPVLVIGTAWPGGEDESEYGTWIADATRGNPGHAPLAEVVDLAGLDPDSLGRCCSTPPKRGGTSWTRWLRPGRIPTRSTHAHRSRCGGGECARRRPALDERRDHRASL